MAANGINGGALLQLGEKMAVDGKTPLFFARGGQFIGVIAVADVVKPTSKQAIAELTGMGIEVVMLTGDNAKTAEAIRRQVGVDRVVAEVFPQDKEKEIRRLQSAGRKWRWSVTVSTMLRPLPERTLVSLSEPERMWRLSQRILF